MDTLLNDSAFISVDTKKALESSLIFYLENRSEGTQIRQILESFSDSPVPTWLIKETILRLISSGKIEVLPDSRLVLRIRE